LAQLSFQNATQGYTDAPWTPGPSWVPGQDALVAYAPGDAIPGFFVQTLAPPHIDNLAPAWVSPIVIPRSTDFSLSWTPADAGMPFAAPPAMWLAMQVTDSTGQTPHGFLFCSVPDSQGMLSVPTALLQNFSAGDLCDGCYLGRESVASDGGVSLHVRTTVAGTASYQATFQ
jgi:hypothetical protein